jgi:hypothetical protein
MKRGTKKLKTKTNTKTNLNTYTLNDYQSGDGMLTTVWGPAMWHFLHTMSFNYPNEPTVLQKKQYRDFILSLEHVLPCKYCRINFKDNLKKVPLTYGVMKNRDTFSRFVYRLHEHINTVLGKKSGLSFEEVRERYEHFRARCTQVTKVEKGCTESLYGKKSKCVIKIVPQEHKCDTFQMNKSCKKVRIIKAI